MIVFEKKTEISVGEKSFLRALLYFDIFSYPLTEQELIRFSPSTVQHPAEVLQKLLQEELIFNVGDFYSLQNDLTLAERRVKGNALAEKRMKSAQRFSKIAASFRQCFQVDFINQRFSFEVNLRGITFSKNRFKKESVSLNSKER